MPRPLNILAVEPFCGGYRRRFAEMLARHSRHRWDWRTLAARRMHRRLAQSGGWFADDLDLRPPTFAGERGPVDVLFATDALPLADLLRRVPSLGPAARVLYLHDHGPNAVPPAGEEYHFSPLPPDVDAVHLLSADAACDAAAARGQLWFASAYHAAAFLVHADEVYADYQDLFSVDPRQRLEERARVVPPPVSTGGDEVPLRAKANRRRVVASAESGDGATIGRIFRRVMERGEDFDLYTIGPMPGLVGVPHVEVDSSDAAAVSRAIRSSRAYLAAGKEAWFDPWAVRAMRADLWTLVPGQGREAFYEELVPEFLQPACFHDDSPARVLNLLQTVWHGGAPEASEAERTAKLLAFEPDTAVAAIDARLDRLVAQRA